MRMFYSLLLMTCLLPFGVEAQEFSTTPPVVLVSVVPHRFFVQQIAGDTVKVGLLVPAGDSAHTYEPSPRQMMESCKADAWFFIGEGFEKRASAAMLQQNPKLRLVDLRQGLDLIEDHHCCHQGHCHDSTDPHIWLSTRLAQQQAKTMTDALVDLYPANSALYKQNLAAFITVLSDLDSQIKQLFNENSPRTVAVSHPAYAYFCRDYGLSQLSIESEGRDPSPQQLTRLLGQLQNLHIRTVFTQPQYSSKGAQLIAKQLGLSVVQLDPYSEDYLNAMQSIAKHFSQP